jgi:hypothetical protein
MFVKCSAIFFPAVSGSSRVGKRPTPLSTMRSNGPVNFSHMFSVIFGGVTPSNLP